MKFQPTNSPVINYSLDQLLASQSLGFGTVLLPLAGQVLSDESLVNVYQYGGMMGVYREDTNQPISNKAVSDGFKTTSHFETFKGNHDMLETAGFNCYKISSLGTNGGHGRLWYAHEDGFKGGDERFPRYLITCLDSHFDGGGTSSASYYTMEAICSNLSAWRSTIAVTAGTKRTRSHDFKVNGLLGQIATIFEAVQARWQWQDGLAKQAANADVVKAFVQALHPVKSLNEDGSPNKSAINARNALSSYIAGQASLRERPVTFEDLLQGVTFRSTHIASRADDNETRQLARIDRAEDETLAENWLSLALSTSPREATLAMIGADVYARG